MVFVDGECLFCHRLALFILRHDRTETIMIASLQSELGRIVSREMGLQEDQLSSVIFYNESAFSLMSEAVIQIASFFPWHLRMLAGIYGILPLRPRDRLYQMVARNRHRIVTSGSCKVFPDKYRQRIL